MPDQPASGDAARMDRASEIFFEVRPLGLAEREEAVGRLCAGDARLKDLVLLLLRGDQAPLPVESMADDIRAAQDVVTQEHAAATVIGAQEGRGSRIGHYRLLERIGEGGFGVVFAAEQTEPVKRRVALKVIKLGMDTRQVVARFEAERQALAMMDHPNIAKVFDAGATETGRPYFVMELVKGLPITQYCDTRKLSIPARLELFTLVCDALQHAHQKGVIHRDIKPTNVLVSEMGEKLVPKVIDFGIAKATNATLTDKTIFTELRQMIGTPEYMSPEQAGVSGLDVDTRTDVYSLGVLLYELLAGTTPFDSKRLRSAAYGEVQRIIREEDPPRPSTKLTTLGTIASVAQLRGIDPAQLGSTLKGELDWVIMKCLEKDRSRRYDSAGALMRDVRRFISGEAVHAVPPSTAYRFKKMVRRNKGPVIAGTLLALALIAGLVGTSLGFFNAERQRKVAVMQKDLATSEKERADENARQARAAEASANRSSYSANMLTACTALGANQISSARASLDAAPASLRGWEWAAVQSRLDTSVRTLSIRTNDRLCPEPVHNDDIIPHPDGRSFFAVYVDRVKRFDLATGQLIGEFAHSVARRVDAFSSLVLSADGQTLFAFGGARSDAPVCGVTAWDLRTNQRTSDVKVDPVQDSDGAHALTSDGSRLLRCRGNRVWIQDVASGRELAAATMSDNRSWYRFSPDGGLLAVTDGRGSLELRDGRTLAHIADLPGHRNYAFSLDFSKDGRWLATASIDGTARVCDLNATPPASVLLEHPVPVNSIRLSPDASLVATSSNDRAVRVWDARTGELKGVFSSGNLIQGSVMFLPDGHTVAARERGGDIQFWNASADTTVNIRGHKALLNDAMFAERPGLIVSNSWDGAKGMTGAIRIWDAETGEPVATLGNPGEFAYTFTVSPTGSHAAAIITKVDVPSTPRDQLFQQRLEILDLTSGQTTRTEKGPLPPPDFSPYPWGLAFDPKGNRLALAHDRRIEILDARSGEVLQRHDYPAAGPHGFGVWWSPDGRVLAWNMSHSLFGGESKANAIQLLDARTLDPILQIESAWVQAMAFSPDGRVICTANAGILRRFDIQSGKQIDTLAISDLAVRAISFSPDGKRLATAGTDAGDVIVLNTNTTPFDRVARFHSDEYVSSVAWDATGTRLMATCDSTIRIWDATPLRDRVAAREARHQALAQVEPMVAKLFDELKEPAKVVERIRADASLGPLARKTALQVVLRKSLEAQAASRDIQPGPLAAPK